MVWWHLKIIDQGHGIFGKEKTITSTAITNHSSEITLFTLDQAPGHSSHVSHE